MLITVPTSQEGESTVLQVNAAMRETDFRNFFANTIPPPSIIQWRGYAGGNSQSDAFYWTVTITWSTAGRVGGSDKGVSIFVTS